MTIEYHFGAPLERVFSCFVDADYLVQRAITLGDASADCIVEDDNDEIVITLTREVEYHPPAILVRLFNPQQTTELVERWKGKGTSRHGTSTLRVTGHPIVVEAEMRLRATSPNTCSYAASHLARAEMPLIGRRIESFILAQTQISARAELEHLAARLRS